MKVKRVILIISAALISAAAALCITFFIITSPNVKMSGWSELDISKLDRIHQTATILDSDGKTIADGIYSNNRIYTPITEIPAATLDAFVSIEDKRFYSHHGIDYIRMLGAAKNNIMSASLKEGASTITQQLIKNTHLSNEKTFSRKIQEIRIAKQLEKQYSKEQILEAYLNIVYFGNNVYGIGQAANFYFGKSVSELNVSESALLAGMINNPSRYNPLTNRDAALKRRNVVLSRMTENGKLSREEAEKLNEDVPNIKRNHDNALSAYIECTISEAAKSLDCLPDELFEKKPTIISHVNYKLFEAIYSSMSDILHESDYNIRLLVIDNSNMGVICDISNFSGCADLKRQPGSALKPFISYAPALEKKLIYPVSVLRDEKTDFDGYTPGNFNDKYYGSTTVSDCLKLSLNIPAVKLTDMATIPYSKAVAERFGLEFSDKDNGLAVALGGLNKGVTLNSLADAYATLANGGTFGASRYVSSIYSDNKLLYKEKIAKRRAIGDDTAFLLTQMLKSCAQSGTAKKLHDFNNAAAKTGTVEKGEVNSDAYCICFTPRFTVAAWYGNDGDSGKIYGGKEPANLVREALEILNDTTDFTAPDSVEKLDIDIKKLYSEETVYLAAPTLPQRYRMSAYFSKNNLPSVYSYPDEPNVFDITEPLYFNDFEIVDSLAE